MLNLKLKLLGGVREEMVYSTYSSMYLKPYIRRDSTANPPWLKLMAELLTKINNKDSSWTLPPRAPIDFSYVQPQHIPAVNSLCNHFFWPGIDCKLQQFFLNP